MTGRLRWGSGSDWTTWTNYVDLPWVDDIQSIPRVNQEVIRADSGKAVTDVFEKYHLVTISLNGIEDRNIVRDLENWYQHAANGGYYSFTIDNTKEYANYTASGIDTGDTYVQMASTSGMAADDWVVVQSQDNFTYEYAQLSTVGSSGVTLTQGAQNDYALSGVVRWEEYHPRLESLDEKSPVLRRPGLIWTFKHKARTAKV